MPKTCKILPKWRNFTTSGHTALKQSFILTFFLLGYGGWLSGKRLEPETRDLVVLNESAKFLVQMIIKGPEFESQCQIQGGCFSNWFAVTNCTYCSDWKTRNGWQHFRLKALNKQWLASFLFRSTWSKYYQNYFIGFVKTYLKRN